MAYIDGHLRDRAGNYIGDATTNPLYISLVGSGALPSGTLGNLIWYATTGWATLDPPTVSSRYLTYSTTTSTMTWVAGSGGISDHNDLSGIQGGSSGKYYHLTDTEYASVTGWDVATLTHVHAHSNTTGLQGGTTGEYYHLTSAQNASVAAWNVSAANHNHNIWALTGYSTLDADTLDGVHAAGFLTTSATHNALNSMQGGQSNQYFHLTTAEHASVQGWDVASLSHNHAHNNLTGIQGGDTNKYYHLKDTEYSSVQGWDHTTLLNKGTNSHTQIDNHIAATNNPHSVTAVQVLPTYESSKYLHVNADGVTLEWATAGGGTGAHNDLTSIQGGTTNEYYHLNATSYASVVAWNVAGTPAHNNTTGIQGGTTNEYYHLTNTQNSSVAAWDVATSAHNHTHNNLTSIQGGTTGQYYHLTQTQNSSVAGWNVAALSHIHSGSEVELLEIGTAGFDDVQDYINITTSGGRATGGDITEHSPADGTADVSEMEGFVKISDSETATTKYFTLAATTVSGLVDNSINYIYVDYNSGSPIVAATTDRNSIKWTYQFNLGRVFRSGNDVEVLTSGVNLYNQRRRTHERWIDTFGGLSYANGLLFSFSGLSPEMSAGVLYAGNNRISISATGISGGGYFTKYYYNPAGPAWVTATATQIDNTYYNNTATGTGLAALTGSKYGIHWMYICPEGELYVLYGKGDYTLAQAQAAQVATPIPNYLNQWAKLAAKVIVQKSATSVYSTTHAWTTLFPVQTAGAHNDLAGLQGGQSGEYYHLTNAEAASITTWNVATVSHTHAHNTTTSLQGGTTNEYYHVTNAQNASIASWDVATSSHNHNIWTLTGYSTINADTLDNLHSSSFLQTSATHNALNSIQGGTTNKYYHLTDTEYASVQAWNVGGGGITRLPATSHTISYTTTSSATGVWGSVDVNANFGVISRLEVYADLTSGQRSSWTALINGTTVTPATTLLPFDNVLGTLATGEFILADNEIIYIGGSATTTPATILRGQKGTNPAYHDDNVQLRTLNDGFRFEIYPNASRNATQLLFSWGGCMTASLTTNATVSQSASLINLSTSPGVISDFGFNDYAYIVDSASSEYIRIQDVYGDVGNNTYDNSLSTRNVTAYAHDTAKKIYRVLEFDVPIHFKWDSGNTMYYIAHFDQAIPATVTATMTIYVDKFS